MQKTYQTLMIIFSAFLFSSLIYLLVGFALTQSGWKAILQGALQEVLTAIFIGLSVVLVLIAHHVRKSIYTEGVARPRAPEQLQKEIIFRSIIVFALSEVPAILGLTLFLLTGRFLFLAILCGISIFAFLLAKPSLHKLQELE